MTTATPRTTPSKTEFVQDVYGSKASFRLIMLRQRLILNGNTKSSAQFDSSLAFAVILRCEMCKGLLNTVEPVPYNLTCSSNTL